MAKEARFNFVLEADLMEKAKVLAAAQNISISELFCRLMAAYAEKNADVIAEYQATQAKLQKRLRDL